MSLALRGSEKELIRSEKHTVVPLETGRRLYANLYEGVARPRHGSQTTPEFNETLDDRSALMNTDGLFFEWRAPAERVPSRERLHSDFYRQPRGQASLLGALSQ